MFWRIKYKNNNIENDRYKKMTKRKKVDAEVFDFVWFRENWSKWEWYEIWAITKKDIFISPTIIEDIPKYVKIWDHIPVYVNPNDPEEYYMDIDNIY